MVRIVTFHKLDRSYMKPSERMPIVSFDGKSTESSKLPLLDIITYKVLSMQTFNLGSCFGKSFILVCDSSL